ncbi:MAG: PHP domain-containing protein [Haloarculaceae archaeon]
MIVADLHVHTTNSDGELTLATLPDAAREAGLQAVAVTDHDRLNPGLDAPVTTVDGVTVIHGVELRVEVQAADERPAGVVGQRVDLLGYGVDPTDELVAELDRLQRDRIERGRAIVECVEDRLGVPLDVDIDVGIGRPHVARAVADATDYTVQGVFDDLIADGRPCYVARDVPSFERGRDLLADACGLVGLAHPFRYPDPEAVLSLTEHLDAVERYYPYDEPVDAAAVDRAIEAYDLLPTGGSDAHGTTLGAAGLDAEAYERVRERL